MSYRSSRNPPSPGNFTVISEVRAPGDPCPEALVSSTSLSSVFPVLGNKSTNRKGSRLGPNRIKFMFHGIPTPTRRRTDILMFVVYGRIISRRISYRRYFAAISWQITFDHIYGFKVTNGMTRRFA